MRKIDLFFAEYRQSHQHQMNKLIHWLCTPLIFWTVLGFISLIPTPTHRLYFEYMSPASLVAILLITLFYARLSLQISLIMFILMLIMEYAIHMINMGNQKYSWIIYLSVFSSALTFQWLGHAIEGKKHSLLKSPRYLLIGSIWFLGFIFKKIGIRY